MKASSRRPKKIQKGTSSKPLVTAFVISLLCAGAFLAVRPSEPKTAVASQKPSVIVTSEDDVVLVPTPLRSIAKGESLASVTFVRTKWPKSKLTMRYVDNVEEASGAVALVALPANLPVPISAISSSSSVGNDVVDRIPPEMRAITVRVDAESAVEGWARPGDFVDVILMRTSSDKDVGIEAKVIAENVKILSAGRSTEPMGAKDSSSRAPATVTLLVDQQVALSVKAAANIGKLTFALRGTGDATPTLAKRVDQKTLLGRARIYSPKKQRFTGKATGPDGKTYLLSDSDWVEANSQIPGVAVEASK